MNTDIQERKIKDIIARANSEATVRSLIVRAEDVAAAGDDRRVSIAFASEFPESRWFGKEILDCSPSSVRLGRLRDGGALLFNHKDDDLIGVVESADVGADRVCRAVVRFDTSAEADVRYQQVRNGVLKHVSVRYRIHKMVLESEADGVETYRITDWEPYEASFVSVPVDHSVGLGRSLDASAQAASADLPPVSQPTPPVITLRSKEKTMTEVLKDPAVVEALRKAQDEATQARSAADADNKRREQIIELGVRYSEYLTLTQVQDACRSNKTPAEVQEMVLEAMKTKHSDTRGAHIGLTDKEAQGFSIARAVRGMLVGDWKDAGFERSVSEAAAAKFGASSRGILIPMDVFAQRTFIAGTASEAGNLIPTQLRTDLFADVLRNNLVLGRLGVTMLYGLTSNIDIPRKTAGSTLGYVTEIATLAETQPTTGKVSMGPKRIGGFVRFSKQAVIQSAMAIEPMLRQDVLDQYARDVETQAINGTGSGAFPRGIRNTAGIGSVAGGTNGLAPAWSHAVDLESACANVNSEPDRFSGYLLNTKTRGAYKKTQRAANLDFVWDNGPQPLNGYRAEVSNVMPSNLTKGSSSGICSSMLFSSDWSSSVIGTFGAVEILVDEVTQAADGMNRLIINGFMDCAVRRAADFAVIDDLLA